MDNKKKILLIDDDPRNIFALTAVLKAKKYTCVSATSAAEGFGKLTTDHEIGIVLMDMMMPDMDGYAAIAHIRSEPALATLPIVSVTAQAMQGDREKCLAAGANEYVSKPIDTQKLITILDKYIT